MHAFHVPRHVHLLLGLVDAIGTLELGLLAALPLLMVAQRTFQLINPTANRAIEPGTI